MWGRGWGGVGHVNVPCTLHTLLMFRTCQDVGQGLGWGGVGHVNVPCTLHTLLMFRKCQDVGQGLGWGGAPCSYNATQKKDGHTVFLQ